MTFSQIEATIFDFDGTLVDSESTTEMVVSTLLRQRQLPDGDLDYTRFHGVTWRQIEKLLGAQYPELRGEPMAALLQQHFHTDLVENSPPLVPGARRAVTSASRALPAAVTSSSHRETVEHVLGELELLQHFKFTVCAEDCTRSKPDPQCFLIAAERLQRTPGHCLVFEDSLAGLRAARAAGMGIVAITRSMQGETLQATRELADLCIDDYTELPPDFFSVISKTTQG